MEKQGWVHKINIISLTQLINQKINASQMNPVKRKIIFLSDVLFTCLAPF